MKTGAFFPVLIAVLVLALLLSATSIKNEAVAESAEREQTYFISDEGYAKTDVQISLADLSLVSGCRALAMTITNDQAFSVYRGKQKSVDTRPLTHDLIRDIFEGFEIKPLAARIESTDENGLYYATLYLQKGKKVLSLDSRPSDAAGIAVRTGTPFYVNKTILEKYGKNVC